MAGQGAGDAAGVAGAAGSSSAAAGPERTSSDGIERYLVRARLLDASELDERWIRRLGSTAAVRLDAARETPAKLVQRRFLAFIGRLLTA